jgi:muramoyltetrapeptide carboxypeptidase LdcA involved in peptidoglycan recycling
MEIIPPRLKAGDEIRVIAPANSMQLPFITEELKKTATGRLEAMGLRVSFGKHINEKDEFESTTVENRLADLHDAFSDKNVKAIITVIGGLNSNQLLGGIDYELIRSNPKILCGYSDITALQHAIYAKTGLVTYSGPHYFTFGVKHDINYTEAYFKKCLFEERPFEVKPCVDVSEWSSKKSQYVDYKNIGPWAIRNGKGTGKIIGANLGTFNLLQGTQFMPKLKNCVLFIEDDYLANAEIFARELQSLFQLPGADTIRGIVVGRFQGDSAVSRENISKIMEITVKGGIPIIANADFGHTHPHITFPIGGKASVAAEDGKVTLRITKH